MFYGDAAKIHKNPPVPITHPVPKRNHWLFSVDPHNYHWDTLFVKGKEMWRGAGSRPDALRALKLVRQGDRVLCYHAAPERALYALAEVTRDPYPDPHAPESKAMVADLRALERLPRQVSLAELRENPLAAQSEVPEKCAADYLSGDRRGVSRDFAHGRNRGLARPAASLNGTIALGVGPTIEQMPR